MYVEVKKLEPPTQTSHGDWMLGDFNDVKEIFVLVYINRLDDR
jgi:hypothetical protein